MDPDNCFLSVSPSGVSSAVLSDASAMGNSDVDGHVSSGEGEASVGSVAPLTDMSELLRKIDMLTNSVSMLRTEVSEQS